MVPTPDVGEDDVAADMGDLDADPADALTRLRDLEVSRETGREALRRAARLAHDAAADAGLGASFRRPPPRLHYPRFGWRQAIRRAVTQRMVSPYHLAGYTRYAVHRARAAAMGEDLVLQGMVFTGRRVHLRPRAGHGHLTIGPWCWLGNDNRLRVHGGRLQLGAKVVMGTANQVNTHLDILIGDRCLLADNGYLCDFDHQFARLDMPIKDQGIAMSPVRIGPDCWLGDKVTVLRGSDVGRGSVIGAQSVVRSAVPPFSIAVGAPARPVRSRLSAGIDPEEAAALVERGLPIPDDPLEA